MEKTIKIILIVSSTFVLSILSCLFVRYCITRYRIMEENRNIQIKNKNFEIIFQNRVIPIDSEEECKDEFNENETRIPESTNDNKV